MSDYKGIFAQEYENNPIKSKKRYLYLVKVINQKTKEVFWQGTVKAYCNKNAQTQWKKDYSELRKQFDSSHCLLIQKL